jgi:hypothetical protein
VFFGKDFLASPNGMLSDGVQERGLQILRSMLEHVKSLGVVSSAQRAAIATEVFRKAHNGEAFLQRIRDVLLDGDTSSRTIVQIVSQADEGQLGFAAAAAINAMKATQAVDSDAVVWDSGASSFQICHRSAGAAPDSPLDTFMCPLGSSVSLSLLLRQVQSAPVEQQSPNPVSASHVQALIAHLTERMHSVVPAWLHLRVAPVLSMCGCNSIFRLCLEILSQQRQQVVESFTLTDAEFALNCCVDQTDDALRRYQPHSNADGPQLHVAKLSLLVAVMRHTGISHVLPVPAVGTCAGLMTLEKYW